MILALRVALAVLVCVSAEVTVENKAFQNVKVSFSQTVAPEDGLSLVVEMQNAITEASQVLKNAVGLKVGSVSFILPSSWDTSAWEDKTIQAASAQHLATPTDITVDGITDSAFGKYPFTVQYAGCGVPGEKIRIPKDFLTKESSFSKGKLLAREWLKFRYGVFDENGFPGDDMYPLYERLYGKHGEYHVTSCTDSEVEYFFRKQDESNCTIDDDTGLPKEDECRIYPTEDSSQNVTSSLMYFHKDFPNIEHICGDEAHKHDDTSSNKQNVLCRGRSIWDVLKSSPDFASQSNEEEPPTEDEIKFSYIQERNPKVVIAWDSTSRNKPMKDNIFSAIRRFMYDLPDGSEYALYSYLDDSVEEVQGLTKLGNWPAGRDVNLLSTFVKPESACAACAIEEAIKVLSPPEDENPELTGTIVIVASSDPEEKEDVLKALHDSEICLLVIAFVDSGATAAGFQKYIDASSCGSFWEVPNNDEKFYSFAKIYEAMESILPSQVNNSVTSTVLTGYLTKDTEMEIPIDTTTGTVVLWLTEYSAAADMTCKQGDLELELLVKIPKSANLAAVQFTPKVSVTAKCSLKYDSDPIMTQVRSTSKPGAYYEVNSWVVDTTEKESKQQMPVIIYASLFYGSYPVRNAEVKAVVKTPDGAEAASFLLADDGRGDPDMTANDGIYSRYFTGFNAEGEYTVSITARDNAQAAWGRNGHERCCGSIVNSENTRIGGAFEKVSEISFKAISGRPENGYKPSRISDLRIGKFDAQNIELKWTAPGGEADSGKARRYEFLLFCENEVCKPNGLLPNWVMVKEKPLPKEYGETQKAQIELMKTAPLNGTFSLSLKSISEYGITSGESNHVYFQLKGDLEDIITTKQPESEKETKRSPPVDAVVGGTIAAVLVVIIIGTLFYVIADKKKRVNKKASDPEGIATPPKNNNNADSKTFTAVDHKTKSDQMRRAESFPVVLYTHDQIKDFKNKKRDPPLYNSGAAPKQWMSLDMLPSNKVHKNKENQESTSVGSSSTINVDDDEHPTTEMSQIHNISQELGQDRGKIDRF